jgi:hypothetical protein
MLGKRGRWQNNFTRKQLSEFLSSTTSGFLHSFGQDFAGKKKYHKYNKQRTEIFQKCRNTGMFDNCTLIADSGGFQISTGRLSKIESVKLYDLYYKWLEEDHKVFDRAFILDIPPGPGCQVFETFNDVFEWNLKSYLKAKSFPKEIRKKLIYVHHFRTPKLWEIYTKIMRDYDMFNSFDYHATGGIVANLGSDMSIPCIIYVLPLIPLINETLKYGRKKLNFHILGGANFRDIFYYELFKKVVEKEHHIELEITYDSSGVFKQLMHARFMQSIDDWGNVHKMYFRQFELNERFSGNRTKIEQIEKQLNSTAKRWGFKEISMDGLYCDETLTLYPDIKSYSFFYALDLYSIMQEKIRKKVAEIFPLYEMGDHDSFYNECLSMTRKMNQGKLTKKAKVKAYSIPRSLDMLKELDEDYCFFLINKFLSKDEFITLDKSKRLITI